MVGEVSGFSFAKPATKRDWRSFSTSFAFVVELSAEMYGFLRWRNFCAGMCKICTSPEARPPTPAQLF